jgi:hypothetical protein
MNFRFRSLLLVAAVVGALTACVSTRPVAVRLPGLPALDGFYLETAKGRVNLPAQLTERLHTGQGEAEVKLADGRHPSRTRARISRSSFPPRRTRTS